MPNHLNRPTLVKYQVNENTKMTSFNCSYIEALSEEEKIKSYSTIYVIKIERNLIWLIQALIFSCFRSFVSILMIKWLQVFLIGPFIKLRSLLVDAFKSRNVTQWWPKRIIRKNFEFLHSMPCATHLSIYESSLHVLRPSISCFFDSSCLGS